MSEIAAATNAGELDYVGFWPRALALVIDGVLICAVVLPPLCFVDDPAAGFIFARVLPCVLVVGFWAYCQATPGKMVIGARIVDAQTGEAPSAAQCIGRYLAYWISGLPLLLGFFWVAVDDRKQGWHDKLAGTVVVRSRRGTVRSPTIDGAMH